MEYVLCLCVLLSLFTIWHRKHIFILKKLVDISSFHVNCSMLLEPVPAQPLPLRNIELSIIMLLNQHENNNINKVTPYPTSWDYTNYMYCLYYFQLLNQS